MDGIPFKSRLAKRQVSRLGDSAVLTTYALDSEDSYGDESYTETTYNITVVQSYVTNTREPFDRRGELGHYMNMHLEFFTYDDLPDGLTDPVDKLPTLTTGGHEYEIMEHEPSQTGLTRLICYRRRE